MPTHLYCTRDLKENTITYGSKIALSVYNYTTMRLLIILSFLFLGQSALSGQDIAQLLKQQDYNQLGLLLDSEARLKVDNGLRIKGSDAVLKALKSKLSAFNPTRIEKNHSGSSEVADSDYIITKLFNAQNDGLRVFVHIADHGSARKISEIKVRTL